MRRHLVMQGGSLSITRAVCPESPEEIFTIGIIIAQGICRFFGNYNVQFRSDVCGFRAFCSPCLPLRFSR
jgi:hypothetical protein